MPPEQNWDFVLVLGPGVVIGICAVLIYYFRGRRKE